MGLLAELLASGEMSGLRYGFPRLIAARLGLEETPSAGAVKAFFDARGVKVSREMWRQWLSEPPPRPDLIMWARIAHVLGVRLSELIEYEPVGGLPPARRSDKEDAPPRLSLCPPPDDEEGPPNPRDYFRGLGNG